MNAPLRRGACPGLSAPMQTGDGLLVRMLPIGTMRLDEFGTLCAASRLHGNGVVEVTARGSIQVRGLTPSSAPRFAATVAALGIAAAEGIAVHSSPLAGLDPDEVLDVEELAADLRCAVAEHGLTARLAPKISVVIDGGGALGLDGLSADVRLRAELKDDRVAFDVSVAGDRASATPLGFVAPENVAAAVIRILEVVARRGRDVRARGLVAGEGVAPFKATLRGLLLTSTLSSRPASCRASTSCDDNQGVDGRDKPGDDAVEHVRAAIGRHRLCDGSFASGIGLAFGHADATSLENLIGAAAARGANGVCATPDRALIFVGFTLQALNSFVEDAEQLGFIVRADDPRRFVVACAGAPICGSAHIAARALAPRIAAEYGCSSGKPFIIHVSGCAKGCAHPGPAALTVVGTAEGCGLVADGTARDTPFATVTTGELPVALARHARALTGEALHV